MNRDGQLKTKAPFLNLPRPTDAAFAGTYQNAILLDAWTRNAHLMALIRFATPVTTQTDLEAHRADLETVLTDILQDLRPVNQNPSK